MAGFDNERPYRFRIAGASHAACTPPLEVHSAELVLHEHCSSGESNNSSQLRQVAARIREALGRSRSADALRASALLDLLLGADDPATLSRVISRLEEAAEVRPDAPEILNDLAVAYAHKATVMQTALDAVRALDAVSKSLALDTTSEALFNRALLLQSLSLKHEARFAWQRYLLADSTSAWAVEARQALAAEERAGVQLEEWERLYSTPLDSARVAALVDRSPQTARDFAGIQLLARWGEAVLADSGTAAQKALRLAAAIGTRLSETNRDAAILDAVNAISRAGAATRRDLARGHLAYAQGRREYDLALFNDAAASFGLAERLLAGERVFAWYAKVYGAATQIYAARFDHTEAITAQAERAIDERRYPSLAARNQYVFGLSLARSNKTGPAVLHYQRAAQLYQAAGDAQSLGSTRFAIAEGMSFLGQYEDALRLWFVGLRELQSEAVSNRLHDGLINLGRAVTRLGYPAAALSFRQEGLHVARLTGRSKDPLEAFLELAQAQLALGSISAAEVNLGRAKALYPEAVPDSFMRARALADLLTTEAELVARRDQRAALPLLGRSIAYFESQKGWVNLLRMLTRRSAIYRQTGDLSRAAADLDSAVAIINTHALSTADARTRAAVHESVLATYDGLISLEIDRGNADRAFEYLESSRRHLVDFVRARQPGFGLGNSTIAAVREKLSPETAVLVFAVLPDRLLSWTVRKDTALLTQVAISRVDLDQRISHYLSLTESAGDDKAWLAAAQELYRLLIKPGENVLRGATRLVVVPDLAITRVPFAALHDGTSYLIESVALSGLPTSALLHSSPPKIEGQRRVLVIGDPNVNKQLLPDLPELPGARAEAREIAGLYKESTLLEGESATANSLRAHMHGHDVVHFAGHARFDPGRPQGAHLVLSATKPEDSGLLPATDFLAMPAVDLSLVILSACSTGERTSTRAGGFSGLTETFIAAGARGVVGSLWPVSDRHSRRLLVEFHRGLVNGQAPPEALRAAQLTMVKSRDPAERTPRNWSAFRFEGN